MKIYKYVIPLEIMSVIDMPLGANIRHVGTQDGKICVWAEIDEDWEISKRTFFVVGTGHPIPVQAKYYVGTVQQPPFVWHIYKS